MLVWTIWLLRVLYRSVAALPKNSHPCQTGWSEKKCFCSNWCFLFAWTGGGSVDFFDWSCNLGAQAPTWQDQISLLEFYWFATPSPWFCFAFRGNAGGVEQKMQVGVRVVCPRSTRTSLESGSADGEFQSGWVSIWPIYAELRFVRGSELCGVMTLKLRNTCLRSTSLVFFFTLMWLMNWHSTAVGCSRVRWLPTLGDWHRNLQWNENCFCL